MLDEDVEFVYENLEEEFGDFTTNITNTANKSTSITTSNLQQFNNSVLIHDQDFNEDSLYSDDDDDDSGNDQEDALLNRFPPANSTLNNSLFGPSVKEIFANAKPQRKRMGKTAGKHLPPEILQPLTEAYEAYARKDFTTATKLLSHCTQLAPFLPDPYLTMAMMHEEMGNLSSATQLYLLAAINSSTKSSRIWEKVLEIALVAKQTKQALAALHRLFVRKPSLKYLQLRMKIEFHDLKDERKGAKTLRDIQKRYPACTTCVCQYADGCVHLCLYDKAILAYMKFIYTYTGTSKVHPERLEHFKISAQCGYMLRVEEGDEEMTTILGEICRACCEATHILLELSGDIAQSDALTLTESVMSYLENLISSCALQNKSPPVIPLDLVLLNMIARLGTGTPDSCLLACRTVLPLLDDWNHRLADNMNADMLGSLYHQKLRIVEELVLLGMEAQSVQILTRTMNHEREIIGRLPLWRQVIVWTSLAELFTQCAQYAPSVLCFERALELDKDNASAWFGLMSLMRQFEASDDIVARFIDRMDNRFLPAFLASEDEEMEVAGVKQQSDRMETQQQEAAAAVHDKVNQYEQQRGERAEPEAEEDVEDAEEELGELGAGVSSMEMQCHEYRRLVKTEPTNFLYFSMDRLAHELYLVFMRATLYKNDGQIDKYIEIMLPILHAMGQGNKAEGLKETLAASSSQRSKIKFQRDFFVPVQTLRTKGGQQTIPASLSRALVDFVKVSSVISKADLLEAADTAVWLLRGRGEHSEAAVVAAIAKAIKFHRNVSVMRNNVTPANATATVEGDTEEAGLGSGLGGELLRDDTYEVEYEYASADESAMKLPRRRRGIEAPVRRRRSRRNHAHDYSLSVTADKPYAAAAGHFLQNPDDVSACNALVRAFYATQPFNDTTSMESVLPISQLHSCYTHSVPLKLMTSHVMIGKRRYTMALELYLETYTQDPSQPLTALCLSVLMTFLSMHLTLVNTEDARHQMFSKSVAFMMQYANLRRKYADINNINAKSTQRLVSLGVQQEVYYNIGRLYHELQLFHLAETMYRRALDIVENEPLLKTISGHVTFEAAHNLCLIYKKSDSPSLVLEVMRKHLSFD